MPPIDYEEDYDTPCPNCGHTPTRYRDCENLGCDDGWLDRYEEDPLWYDPGDIEMCTECWGTGYQKWCPKCGFDLNKPRAKKTPN